MFLAPLAERYHRRLGDKRNGLTLSRPGDCGPFGPIQRVPQALSLAVEDQEHVPEDIAADAELIRPAVPLASVNHGQLCEWSPSHGDGLTPDVIVHEFVVVEQPHRVGPGILAVGVPDDHDLIVGLGLVVVAIRTRG